MRFFAIAIFIAAPAIAQNNYRQPEFAPIAGYVMSAADGRPIAGAIVHYRGEGGDFMGKEETNPPSIQGEVTTAADGSYTLPKLPPGDFIIRASAPDFFAAHDYVSPLPVGQKPMRLPLPPGYRGPPPPIRDGTLRLHPDPVDLRPMADAALVKFQQQQRDHPDRTFTAASFSPDHTQFGFVTLDLIREKGDTVSSHCIAWSYSLANGTLSKTDLPGSPYVGSPEHPDIPPGFCNNVAAVWDGEMLYIVHTPSPDESPSAATGIEVFAMRASTLVPVATAERPVPVQALIADRLKVRPYYSDDSQKTNDGLYSIRALDAGGRGNCVTLQATSKQPKRTRTIAEGCTYFNFKLDRSRDIVFYSGMGLNPQPNGFEQIGMFDLKTHSKSTFDVPFMNEEPQLLVEQSLPSGAIHLAYAMRGDCDPATSDYSQPGQPDGALGNTPNQFSICFATLPATHP